jgi:putative transcription factor
MSQPVFQDWQTVTIGKKKPTTSVMGDSTMKKPGTGGNSTLTAGGTVTVRKYKEDEFGMPITKGLKKGFGANMAQVRTSKGLSQKDLASKIGEKIQVVKDYESEKVVNVNQTIIRKMEKHIGSLKV